MLHAFIFELKTCCKEFHSSVENMHRELYRHLDHSSTHWRGRDRLICYNTFVNVKPIF